MSVNKAICPDCGSDELKHMHNAAHGIGGTHMAGSERFECKCGKSIYHAEGIPLGFDFKIDGVSP